MARLSVIIPAYRRHPLTVRHVEECMRSTLLPDEIVVVNDGGDPILRDMLYAIPRSVPMVYARVDEDILWNYNGACNLGVWLSDGNIIALEDTDHIPDRALYEDAMKFLSENDEIDRIGVRRKVVHISELDKPMSEWGVMKGWGTNQMVTIFRRDLYLKLKGQDERFAGNYGYMAMDWASRYRKLGAKTATISSYWAIVGDEGEPGLKRGMSPENRRLYKENANGNGYQHPGGILNFTYQFERFDKNI